MLPNARSPGSVRSDPIPFPSRELSRHLHAARGNGRMMDISHICTASYSLIILVPETIATSLTLHFQGQLHGQVGIHCASEDSVLACLKRAVHSDEMSLQSCKVIISSQVFAPEDLGIGSSHIVRDSREGVYSLGVTIAPL